MLTRPQLLQATKRYKPFLNRTQRKNKFYTMKKFFIILICFLPFIGFSQFKIKFKEMEKIENPNFNNYDKLVFEATSYVFSNPMNPKSEDFFCPSIIGSVSGMTSSA